MNNRINQFSATGCISNDPYKNQKTNLNTPQNRFNDLFQQEIQKNKEIKFSKHAEERIQSRNIQLTSIELHKLEEAVAKVAAKGAKESLVLMDQVALVVSVKNNTVITAVAKENLKENVFTNIDSAIVL